MSTTESTAVLAVRRWVDLMVVGLNLCPFARTEVVNKRVHFVETEAQSEVQQLEDLAAELTLLAETPSIETTLLVHPQVLKDFSAYNQFLDEVDVLLHGMHLDGKCRWPVFTLTISLPALRRMMRRTTPIGRLTLCCILFVRLASRIGLIRILMPPQFRKKTLSS